MGGARKDSRTSVFRTSDNRGRHAMVWAVALAASVSLASGAGAETEPRVLFTDITTAAGIDFVETLGDDTLNNIVEATGVGCGFFDYDRDGWMDVYIVNGFWMEGLSDPKLDLGERKKLAAATDHLYRNRGDGTFEDVTERAGVGQSGYGMGVVVADYDGDGDPDIYVTNYGPNFLYRNNGDGTFTDVAKAAGVDDPRFSVGAVFFDYNRDGRLDLYVGSYLTYDPNYKQFYAPDGFPGPLAYAGQHDKLFRGNPDGTFTDVSRTAGIEIEPAGRAMGVGVFDYDDDGFPDVFVSNDAMENFLLRNKGDGTFENQALLAGVAYGENGNATAAMCVEVGDIDTDGLLDLFVSDMTFTCLYRNFGEGLFEDFTVRSGIAALMGQYHTWGSVLADFDLDGNLDLFACNGDAHHLEAQEDILFVGDGTGRFVDVSETAGDWMRRKYVGRGVAAADFDNDGDLDLLVVNLNDRPILLRNDTPRRGRHWLGVRLIGRSDNRDAIGATVRIRTGKRTMVRYRTTGGSYLSQHDARLYFGLGEYGTIDEVAVTWPDGTRQVTAKVRADKVLTIRRQDGGEKRTQDRSASSGAQVRK